MRGTRTGLLATTLFVGSTIGACKHHEGAAGPSFLSARNPVVFEAFYSNGAWGFVLTGFYVDSRGNVVAYNRDGDVWSPLPAPGGRITSSDLFSKYRNPRYLGTVSASTLSDMRGRLPGAADGRIEHGVEIEDAGDTTYVGYEYSRWTDTYKEVLLAGLNGRGINISDDAKLLAAWLQSLECLYDLELPRFRSTRAEMADVTSVAWLPSLPEEQDPTFLAGAVLLGTGFGPLKGRVFARILGVPVGVQRPIISDYFEIEGGSIADWRDDEVSLRFTTQDRDKVRQAVGQVRGDNRPLQRSPTISFRIKTRQCTASSWS